MDLRFPTKDAVVEVEATKEGVYLSLSHKYEEIETMLVISEVKDLWTFLGHWLQDQEVTSSGEEE